MKSEKETAVPPRQSAEWKAFIVSAIGKVPSERTAAEKAEISWAIENNRPEGAQEAFLLWGLPKRP